MQDKKRPGLFFAAGHKQLYFCIEERSRFSGHNKKTMQQA